MGVVMLPEIVAVLAGFLAVVAVLGVVVIPERCAVVSGFLADLAAVALVEVVVVVVV